MFDVIMASSKDNFVAHGPSDDMSWTGHEDKAIFNLVTHDRKLCAGKRTYDLLPPSMKNRTVPVCFKGISLNTLANDGYMLIGGQTIVLAALQNHLVRYVYMTWVNRDLGDGQPNLIYPYLFEAGCMFKKIRFHNVYMRIYDARVYV